MSELDEIRQELDHVSHRVNILETRMERAREDAAAACIDARMADRKVSQLRAEIQPPPPDDQSP